MKNNKIILILFLLLSGFNICQVNIPDEQSNPDLNFNVFLSGVKYVSVVFNDETQIAIDKGEYEDFGVEIFNYLKELGFEYIALTSEQKMSLSNAPSYCEIAYVSFFFESDKSWIKNIQMAFRSCLGDRFLFNSKKRIENDGDWLSNLAAEWRKLCAFKPNYQNSARLKYKELEQTNWNNITLKENFDKFGCVEIEGIYEKIRLGKNEVVDAKYLLGIIAVDGVTFDIVYLGGANNYIDWKEGEIKGKIVKTATPNFYSVNWIMADKSLNEDVYCELDENQFLKFVFVGGDEKINNESKFVKLYPTSSSSYNSKNVSKSGTAFAISTDGYIITNHHVIEGANNFSLISNLDGDQIEYSLKKVAEDKKNDIALLKIEDDNFDRFPQIPFSIKTNISDVGEEVFALGYPLISSMGTELKATDGIISSKSGFDGDITSYQISAPVQPGNSGGPLFDKSGNLLGIISAKHKDTDNVSYALKANYLTSFLESLSTNISTNHKNLLKGKSLTEIIKKLSRFVFIIKCN